MKNKKMPNFMFYFLHRGWRTVRDIILILAGWIGVVAITITFINMKFEDIGFDEIYTLFGGGMIYPFSILMTYRPFYNYRSIYKVKK